MLDIDFLNLSNFLNHNHYMIKKLQGKKKVIHMEGFGFDML